MNEKQHKDYYYPTNLGHEAKTCCRREVMSIYNKKQERFCSVQIVIEKPTLGVYKTYTIERYGNGDRRTFGHEFFTTSHECMAHHYTKVANLIEG